MPSTDTFSLLEDALLAQPPSGRATAPRPPVRVRAFPGVYGPAEDSQLLAVALGNEQLAGARVLDLCTGTGILAVTAARAGAADVVAIDVSRRAALAARFNLWCNGSTGSVRRGDLLRVAPLGLYDVVVANPPYVPARCDRLPSGGVARAWDGGRDGRAIIDRICNEVPARLRPGGRLLMVHSEVADGDRTVDLLRGAGLDVDIVTRRALPFGPVMRRRAPLLRAAGLISDGQRVEELIVIRAHLRGTGDGPA